MIFDITRHSNAWRQYVIKYHKNHPKFDSKLCSKVSTKRLQYIIPSMHNIISKRISKNVPKWSQKCSPRSFKIGQFSFRKCLFSARGSLAPPKAAFWSLLGSSWSRFGGVWKRLEAISGGLEASRAASGRFLRRLKAI